MPRPCKLTFYLLTLKVVSESRVTCQFVPILVFLGLSVLDLGPMYETDRQTSDAHHRKINTLSILMAIFQINLGLPVFIEAKDDGGGGDNWTTGDISRAKLQSNHHQQTNFQFFFQAKVLKYCIDSVGSRYVIFLILTLHCWFPMTEVFGELNR